MAVSPIYGQNTLNFRPIEAKYSTPLDRIIMVSAGPNLLHIYNPVTNTDSTVALSKAPNGLSVAPGGLMAAVSHDALITLVNLSTATVVRTYVVPSLATLQDIVLTADYVYQPPYFGVQLSTGTVTSTSTSEYGRTRSALHPGGKVIYAQAYGLRKFDISNGILQPAPYTGFYEVCPPMQFSLDGSRLYDGCGNVRVVGPNALVDPVSAGSLAGTKNSGQAQFLSFDESASAKLLAGVGTPVTVTMNSGTSTTSSEVRFYDTATLQQAGSMLMPTFVNAGRTYGYLAKWAFFNSQGTMIHTVMQSENAASLLNDFATASFPLSGSSSCGLTFSPNTVAYPASGAVGTVTISSDSPCTYQATVAVPWIEIVSGGFGNGNGTVTFLVRPNSGAARSAGITAGNQTLTVYQDGVPPAAPAFQRTPYKIISARYSKSLDRLVFVSSSPNELHVYDPLTVSDRYVALNFIPTKLSLSPDGLYAGISHVSGFVRADLSTLSIVNTSSAGNGELVLGGNGYAYISSSSVNLATGAVTPIAGNGLGSSSLLHPSGNSIYSLNGAKFDITQGAAKLVPGARSFTSSCYGDSIWITEDGARIFDACGNGYRSSDSAAEDGQPYGKLPGAVGSPYSQNVKWLANSISRRSTAVLASTGSGDELLMYADSDLALTGRVALTRFNDGLTSSPAAGRYLFWNAAGTLLIGITQSGASYPSGVTGPYAIEVFSGDVVSGCNTSLSSLTVNASGAGGPVSVSVSTGPGCIWDVRQFDSNSPTSWVTIPTATVTGPGLATVTLTANTTGAARTAKIVVAGQTVTITQPPIDGLTVSQPQLSFSASGGNGQFSVTAPATMRWNVASNADWVRGPSSTVVYTGSNTVCFTVTANPGTARSTTLYVGTQVVSITQAGVAAAGGSRFVAVSPCRLVDTRTNSGFTGQFGAPSLPNKAARDFVLPSGRCGLPTSASAYSLNVTVVPKGQLAFLTIWPAGQPQPLVSTLNSFDGRVKANAAIVPAGAGGAVSIYATEETDLVLDVNGYFTTATTSETLVFYGANCRLYDSRGTSYPYSTPVSPMQPNQPRTIAYTTNNCSSNAAVARAYVLNVTAIPSGPLAYLTLWPTGSPQPLVSTLNSPKGTIVTNQAIVPAGINGAIDAFATNTTHLVLDITGYFAPPGQYSSGYSYYPVTPCRAVDTRNSPGPNGGPALTAGQSRAFPMVGICGISPSAGQISGNLTAVPLTSLGHLDLNPAYSNTVTYLSSVDGSVVSNAATFSLSTSGGPIPSVFVIATDTTHFILDVNGYFAP